MEAVHWAAKNGDRSENGDYIYGKKRLREIDRRIRFPDQTPGDCRSHRPIFAPRQRPGLLRRHRALCRRPAGEERSITILGIDEANSALGEVSWVSPIARARCSRRARAMCCVANSELEC